MLFIFGCGPSSQTREFHDAIAKTKIQYRIADVRAAVTPLYGKHDIPVKALPQIIVSLPIFEGAEAEDIYGSSLDTNELIFYTGSGFGHWGIIVYMDPRDNSILNASGGEVIPWGDGVYFYRE